jgi:histidine triad (HIT) family protein
MRKQHIPFLSDLDEVTGSHLFIITMQMPEAIRHSGVQCEVINLFLADGEAAFQEMFHVHMHVFPRFQSDPLKIHANLHVKPTRQKLDEIAERIRRANELLRQQADA